jgi:hypothetical protein
MKILITIFIIILLYNFFEEIKEYLYVKFDNVFNNKKIIKIKEIWIEDNKKIVLQNEILTKKINKLDEILEQKI